MNRKPHVTVGIIGGGFAAQNLAAACLAAGHDVIRIEAKGERFEDRLESIKGLKADVVLMDDIPEAPNPSNEYLIQAVNEHEAANKCLFAPPLKSEREPWRRGRPMRKR